MTPASRPRVPAAFRRLAAAAALLALASPALVPPARAQAPTATVRTDRDASGMRVVITLDMPVSSTVIEETGRLIVRHDRTVAFDPVRLEVGGDVLRSIEGATAATSCWSSDPATSGSTGSSCATRRG